MGLISIIKELFSAKRYILQALEEQEEQMKQYAALSPDELLALADEDLYSAMLYRINGMMGVKYNTKTAELLKKLSKLNASARALYVVSELDWEMDEDGGLRDFFLDDSRALAPLVSESLQEIGAQEHQTLFDTFVHENQVNLNRPQRFAQNPHNDRLMAAFDRAYKILPSLEEITVGYIRQHITELMGDAAQN